MTSPSVGYALRAGSFGPETLTVQSVSGREAVSKPFRFDITITAPVAREELERKLLAQRALLAMRSRGRVRHVPGIITQIRAEGARSVGVQRDLGEHQYTLRLSPRVSLLTQRRGSRIFRGQSAPSVVASVLASVGVTVATNLSGTYPVCDYLTQYDETDLELVQRLAAENGLLWYFRTPELTPNAAEDRWLGLVETQDAARREVDWTERIVLTDSSRYASIGDDSVVHYSEAGGLSSREDELVSSFELTRSVRATRARFRDFDPQKPRAPLESTVALANAPSPGSDDSSVTTPEEEHTVVHAVRQVASELAIDAQDKLTEPADLELYEHGARHLFGAWESTHEEPARMLRQARRDARRGAGSASSVRFTAGATFTLEDHPELSGDYLIVAVRHRGGQAFGEAKEGAHIAEFEAVPASVVYIPKRPSRRVVQVCLTATVVGPGSNDVHVNGRGEIQVRFHWDRRHPASSSTGWIRTMQAWAGAGWGTQFIPRVGMEVVVAFEAGDPDKPIVLGAVYNAASPPAFPLPRDKSKSGFRTRSTPDGDGFNELSFEDSTGAERVFMRAQRDLDTHVERDRNTIVLGRDNTRVDGDSTRAVSGVDRTVASGTRAAEIGGDDSIHVRGHRNVIVGRDLDEHVSGDRRVRVEHDDFREIMGEAVLTAHGGVTGDLRGSASVVVGRHDAKRSLATRVEGTANLSASEVLDLDSDKEVVLRCGTSAIRMTANAIELTADTVTLRGKDSRVLLADGEAKVKTKSLFQVVSDDKVVIVSSGASIGLGAEVKVDGAKILLNSPNRATDDLTADEAETTTIELVDQDGNAVPGERYRLVLDDGTEITGVLDDAGKATVYAKTSGQIEFPDMAEAERA